jgi:hypothetical protein
MEKNVMRTETVSKDAAQVTNDIEPEDMRCLPSEMSVG